MQTIGIILIGLSLLMGNFLFWLNANFEWDWNMSVCMFMAFVMPALLLGTVLMFR